MCHFQKMACHYLFDQFDFLVIISCYIYPFCPKTRLGPTFLKKYSLCISLVRQIGFPIHFISIAHCCHLFLIEDITQMWQDACHIWKYYIIKCYKSLVIFTYNGQIIFTKMTQYCYFPDCWAITWLLTNSRESKSNNISQDIKDNCYTTAG